MELYVLDEQIRRITVIDTFESCIWTERFNEAGDFQLVVPSTKETRGILTEDLLVACNKSYYVMKIESVEKKVDDEGRQILEISGPSLETIMMDRVAKETMSNLTTDPDWELTGLPADIAREIFKHICIDGALSTEDIIPFITEGDFLATPGSWYALDPELVWNDAIGEWEDAYSGVLAEGDGDTGDEITISLKPQTVFQAIQELCQVYGLGFRLIRNFDNSELYFEVYQGIDRTSGQDELSPIQFSADLDNLANSTEFSTLTGSKNVAIVFAPNGVRTVYGVGASEDTSGFDRRVLYVDASDVDLAAGAPLDLILDQRGNAALAQARKISAFDGEISQYSSYKYGRDFNLGDLVELQNNDGVTSKMRVTEQIFVHDGEGEREYPTLTRDLVVDPGSWFGQPPNLEWDEALGYWEDA